MKESTSNKIGANANCFLLLFMLLIPFMSVFAQVVNCDERVLSMSTPSMQNYTFDKFSHYVSGITEVGATQLRVEVDSVDFNPDCRWKLTVEIDNNPAAPTPIDQWESLNQYGTFSTPPILEIIEIRVKNSCNTVTLPLGYNQLFLNNGDNADIMKNPAFGVSVYPAQCPNNPVNSPGSYISTPGAYTFIIDYRLIPGLDYRPGIYQISLKFRLEEDL